MGNNGSDDWKGRILSAGRTRQWSKGNGVKGSVQRKSLVGPPEVHKHCVPETVILAITQLNISR